MSGDVTIAVDFSTVNYKDGVALSGRAPIIQKFPLIPGIDLSGTVQASSYSGIEVGDRVVANGWSLSQTHHGGYAQKARLRGDWLVKIPASLSSMEAMSIGTAGYTAMLSVLALEQGNALIDRATIGEVQESNPQSDPQNARSSTTSVVLGVPHGFVSR